MRVELSKDVTLYQGDCLEILPTLRGEGADLVFSDPPYGINYQSARRTDSERKPKIINDEQPFIEWLPQAYRITKLGGSILCFCHWKVQEVFKKAITLAGYDIKSQVIWDRRWHGLGDLRSEFAPQHDIIWFGAKGNFVFSAKRPKSVVSVQRLAADALIHPNEKPVELLQHLIEYTTKLDDIVLDCLMGSGTTGVACIKTGRKFIGIEIDKGYFEIAKSRIEETLKTAEPLEVF